MTTTGVVATAFADAERRVRSEVATRTGPRRVDRAAHRHADLTVERAAAWRGRIGATHAPYPVGDRHGQCVRHPAGAATGQLGYVKIDAQPGTAGSAAATVVGHVSRTGNRSDGACRSRSVGGSAALLELLA